MRNKECDYCKRDIQHGGKCQGKHDNIPCLIFEKDPRGKWIMAEEYLTLPMSFPVPKKNQSSDIWEVDGISKTITFYHVEAIKWLIKGEVAMLFKCNFGYWSDEGLEDKTKDELADIEAKSNRRKFKIVKKEVNSDNDA